MQDYKPQKSFDLFWCQWCLGFLADDEVVGSMLKFISQIGGIIEHVHNQMAVFTIGHYSNLTRSAWAS